MRFQASQPTQDETPSEVAMADTMAAISLIQKSHFLLGTLIVVKNQRPTPNPSRAGGELYSLAVSESNQAPLPFGRGWGVGG